MRLKVAAKRLKPAPKIRAARLMGPPGRQTYRLVNIRMSPSLTVTQVPATFEIDAIYMVAYFNPHDCVDPRDPFFWGLYVQTCDNPGGTLFCVDQKHAVWIYTAQPRKFPTSRTSVQATKLGYVPKETTKRELKSLLANVPLGTSLTYPGEWTCNIWVRDAAHLLVSKGWIQCEDVNALWMDVRSSALLLKRGSRKCEITTASKSK